MITYRHAAGLALAFASLMLWDPVPPSSRADPLGTTIIGSWGGTRDEVEAAQGALKLCDDDQEAAIRAFSDLLRGDYGNRVARLGRAKLYIEAGTPGAAEADLSYLELRDPDFPGLLKARARAAHVRGDRKAEVKALTAIVSRPARRKSACPENDAAIVRDARIKLLELDGDIEGVTAVWHAVTDTYTRRGFEDGWQELGDSCVRMGRYREGVAAYSRELEIERKRPASVGDLPGNLTKRAVAYLLCGKKEDALRDTLEALRSTGDDLSPTQIDFVAEDVLRARLLSESGVGGDADRDESSRRLSEIARARSPGHTTGVSSIVPAILDPAKRPDQARRIAAILEQAPHLEWALWSAAFLAKTDSALEVPMGKLLPSGSLQANVAKQLGNDRQENRNGGPTRIDARSSNR